MNAQCVIDVRDRAERRAILAALSDQQVRAFVVVIGTLMSLPSDRARARVLQYVHDKLTDEHELRASLPGARVEHVDREKRGTV